MPSDPHRATRHLPAAQTKVELRLGWSAPEHRFGAALIINNALNKQCVLVPQGESAYTLGTPYGSVTPPRFYGVEVSASL